MRSFFSRVHATLQPALSVGLSVRPSVTLCFFGVYWRFCSCPTTWLVYFNTAPAHPRATRVAVYPALFYDKAGYTATPGACGSAGIRMMRVSLALKLRDLWSKRANDRLIDRRTQNYPVAWPNVVDRMAFLIIRCRIMLNKPG